LCVRASAKRPRALARVRPQQHGRRRLRRLVDQSVRLRTTDSTYEQPPDMCGSPTVPVTESTGARRDSGTMGGRPLRAWCPLDMRSLRRTQPQKDLRIGRKSDLQAVRDGPGRDRTCDLGIKSLGSMAAMRCSKRKLPAKRRNRSCRKLRLTAASRDEPVRAHVRARGRRSGGH
jgi:hypothetical protein